MFNNFLFNIFRILLLTLAINSTHAVDIICQQQIYDYLKADPTACYIRDRVMLKKNDTLNFLYVQNADILRKIEFVSPWSGYFEISFVPVEIFEKFPNVEKLVLEASVKQLNVDDFKSANNLKNLTIGNQLETIPANILADAKKLLTLSFEKNRIFQVDDFAFDHLDKLEVLNLGENKLKVIRTNWFKGLSNLKCLYLPSNEIETIQQGAFDLPSLTELSLFNNRLQTLPDDLFSGAKQLEILTLNMNEIIAVPKSIFDLRNLKKILLNSNNITGLDLGALSQLPKLDSLHFDGDSLPAENAGISSAPSKSVLTYISIHFKKLTNKNVLIPLGIFKRLERLNIITDEISQLDFDNGELRQMFPNLKVLYVDTMELNYKWMADFTADCHRDGIRVVLLNS